MAGTSRARPDRRRLRSRCRHRRRNRYHGPTETRARWTISTTETPIDRPGRIFTDAARYADPEGWHRVAAELRRRDPITWVDESGYPPFWAVTRHADVMAIERQPDVFTNAPMPVMMPLADTQGVDGDTVVKTLIQLDGDDHKKHRNLVSDWFKPANVRRMEDRVDELSRRYVDRMAAMDGRCDFATDIAVHFPLQVLLSILGLPEADHDRMLTLTQELFGAEDPDIGRVGEDSSVLDVVMDFVAYFTDLTAERRATPGDDLASVIANGEIDGAPLPDMDTFGFYLIIATAGHDTTSSSIAGGLQALIENPDQLALLQSDPTLIDDAADELIRFVSPVKHFLRTCQEETTIGDVTIAPGDITLLSYASANRDDEVFPDPFTLDVCRPNASMHLAFGFGRHYCLGAHLARMELRALFRNLLPRLATIELTDEPRHVAARLVSGPKTLPISYTWR